jgi:hypothetical protein
MDRTLARMEEMHTKIRAQEVKYTQRDHLEDLGVDRRIKF